jgi:hypothetical protein
MKKFLDTDHPFFRPLWVRVGIVAVCLGWGLFEFATGSPFWAVIFLGLGAYAAWGFFVAFEGHRED